MWWLKTTKQETLNIKQQTTAQLPPSMISRSLIWPAPWPRWTEVIHTFVSLKIMMVNSPYWREFCQRPNKSSRNNKTRDRLLNNKVSMNIKCLFNQGNSKRQTSSKINCRSRFCHYLKMVNSFAPQIEASTPKESTPLFKERTLLPK